jgi:hypothetical protein
MLVNKMNTKMLKSLISHQMRLQIFLMDTIIVYKITQQ